MAAWKVSWSITASGTHAESNSSFRSFANRTTSIIGEATVHKLPDGSTLATPFQLTVNDALYAVRRDYDERKSFSITRFNIADSGRYSGGPDPFWTDSHMFEPQRDEAGFFMSVDPFDSSFFDNNGQWRSFTYNTQVTDNEGTHPPIRSQQDYYTQILLNQVTASQTFERIPGDSSGRFFQLNANYTVSTADGGEGGAIENVPVQLSVSIRPAEDCAALGYPIDASNPGLARFRDAIRVELEPDVELIRFDDQAYVKARLTCDGVPIKNAQLQIGANVYALSGFHKHHDPARPRGWLKGVRVTPENYLNVIQLTTDANGVAEFDYLPGADTLTEKSDIAGVYRLRGYAPAFGVEKWFDIDAREPGLKPLPLRGQYHEVVGQTAEYPQNNYGTAETVSAITFMASYFWESQRKLIGDRDIAEMRLLVNDISLPWGGHFDVKGWDPVAGRVRGRRWQPPHFAHEQGYEVDFSLRPYRERLIESGMIPSGA